MDFGSLGQLAIGIVGEGFDRANSIVTASFKQIVQILKRVTF